MRHLLHDELTFALQRDKTIVQTDASICRSTLDADEKLSRSLQRRPNSGVGLKGSSFRARTDVQTELYADRQPCNATRLYRGFPLNHFCSR